MSYPIWQMIGLVLVICICLSFIFFRKKKSSNQISYTFFNNYDINYDLILVLFKVYNINFKNNDLLISPLYLEGKTENKYTLMPNSIIEAINEEKNMTLQIRVDSL